MLPQFNTSRNWRFNAQQAHAWLPARGSVFFTLLVAAALILTGNARAASPGAPLASGASTAVIPYQGRLTNAGSVPLSGTYSLTFKLYNVSSGGAALWTEAWPSVSVTNGLFNVLLGSTTPITQSVISSISSLWLGITVGADTEMTPRAQIGSVPYALQANYAYGLSAPDGNPQDAVSVDANGNVGVGTTSPGAALDVRSDTSPQLLIAHKTSGQYLSISHAGIFDTSAATNYHFRITGSDKLYIGNDGNVGIGTTSPAERLSVSGSNPTIEIVPDGSSQFPGLRIWNANGKTYQAFFRFDDAGGELRTGDDVAWPYTFYTSGAERMRIAGDGNVGIGTTDPQSALDVRGTAPQVMIRRLSDSYGMTIHYDGTFDMTSNGNYLFNIGGTPILFMHGPSGNVCIGPGPWTTPSNILTIQQGSSTDPIADAWTTYSSKRWKTKIKTIDNALELVQQLRGVRFAWTANGKPDIGLVAEEVGKVIPEVVVYEANGVDARSVDYSRLVAVLIEAVKEQQGQVVALQQQNGDLETRVAALERATQADGVSVASPLAGGWNTLLLGMIGGGLLVLAGLVVGQRYRH